MQKQFTKEDVKAWRKEMGLNQPDFGQVLGMSRATLARIETGESDVPVWMALAYRGWLAEQEEACGTVPVLSEVPADKVHGYSILKSDRHGAGREIIASGFATEQDAEKQIFQIIPQYDLCDINKEFGYWWGRTGREYARFEVVASK